MAIMTAQEYRRRRAPRDTVTLPGSALTVSIRAVDVVAMALAQDLEADRYDTVLREIAATVTAPAADQAGGGSAPAKTVQSLIEAHGGAIAAIIDAVVCAGVVTPTVTRTRQDDGAEALWVGELDLGDKLAILAAVTALTQRRAALLRAGTDTTAAPEAASPIEAVSA